MIFILSRIVMLCIFLFELFFVKIEVIALLLEFVKKRGLLVVLRRKWPFLLLTKIYITIIMLPCG